MTIYIIILAIGVLGALLLGGKALSGPSPHKSLKRRIELVKERHADGILAAISLRIWAWALAARIPSA